MLLDSAHRNPAHFSYILTNKLSVLTSDVLIIIIQKSVWQSDFVNVQTWFNLFEILPHCNDLGSFSIQDGFPIRNQNRDSLNSGFNHDIYRVQSFFDQI